MIFVSVNGYYVSIFLFYLSLTMFNLFRIKMDRLEADLRFFMHELEREDDPFRRRLLQVRVVATQRSILALMTEEREELDRQNANMERALAIIRKREEDKKQ